MAIILNVGRFTNSGTMYGDVTMGDSSNYVDNRNGFIYGKIKTMGGNDTFLGGKLSEVIDGGAGNDRLDGGLGNDTIYGGAGRNTLIGGVGQDSFVFTAAPASANLNIVQDFSSADDTFKIKQSVFTTIGRKGKLGADAFHLGAKAADAEDRIIYHKATGSLYFDADGTGSMAQIKIATLSNKAALVLSDFLVI